MAENSKIEWTDHTFNPWVGCTKISPACDHCYAESWAKRSGSVVWGGDRRRTTDANWNKVRRWDREAFGKGIRPRVFCASLADVFDNEVPTEWRSDLFDMIERTPSLDWLLLTKRIGNALRLTADARTHDWLAGQRNVWIGATVCNQSEADRDIPKLLEVPARVRFLSVEPMLGPIDLTRVCITNNTTLGRYADCLRGHLWDESAYTGGGAPMRNDPPDTSRIDWVIAGGESGPKARPMHPSWVRSLRDQCAAAGVPFLFKQWGEWAPNCLCDRSCAHPETKRPEPGKPGVMFRCGKTNAGRLLDEQLHDGYPQP